RSDLTVVGYRIADDSPVIDRRVDSLLAPEGVKFVAVFRDDYAISSVDSHMIRSGDLLYVICPQEKLLILNQMLLPTDEVAELEQAEYFGDFTLRGDALLGEIMDLYGGEAPDRAKEMTLSQFFGVRFKNHPVPGDRVLIGPLEFVAREVDDGGIVEKVGLRIRR
ncbi:MAG: transporter associated domain-containing protein, partial [Betaproteobacteria bacterium]